MSFMYRGHWSYNYLCNQCLSPLRLRVRIPLRWEVLNTTLCNKVCQWLATCWWFSSGTPVSSTNKTDCYHITEILLKVALNTMTLPYPLLCTNQCHTMHKIPILYSTRVILTNLGFLDPVKYINIFLYLTILKLKLFLQ